MECKWKKVAMLYFKALPHQLSAETEGSHENIRIPVSVSGLITARPRRSGTSSLLRTTYLALLKIWTRTELYFPDGGSFVTNDNEQPHGFCANSDVLEQLNNYQVHKWGTASWSLSLPCSVYSQQFMFRTCIVIEIIARLWRRTACGSVDECEEYQSGQITRLNINRI
jgi:hypothetical protein